MIDMAPGWYGRPDDPQIERWWDGQQWTEHARGPQLRDALGPELLDLSPAELEDHFRRQAEDFRQRTEEARQRTEEFRKKAEETRKRTEEILARSSAPTGQAAIICPHCQVRGHVQSSRVRKKRGVSGGKATGAVLTGGLSLFATGLSRKETVTEMYCCNCRTKWYV